MIPHNRRATNEQVIEAYKATGSVWRAAERLGICGQSVHERLRHIGVQVSVLRWTEEEVEVMKYLASEALPVGKIASRLGRTYSAIACKLSEVGVRHPFKTLVKIKRGGGLTKKKVRSFAMYILNTGISVTKAAKQKRLSTSGLVNALQIHAPDLWLQYITKNATLPPLECQGCGNVFTPLNTRQKYCVTKCGAHARADASYFGGRRREAIGLAEGICQLCEKKKNLSVHHIFGKQNDPENAVLIALCAGCHQLVGILGRRGDALDTAFWENLISLATARALADKGTAPTGMHVCVDIETMELDEIESIEPEGLF